MHPGTGTGVVVALIAVCPCMRHASGQTSFPPCHLPRARHVPVLDFFTFLVACHCRPTVGEIPTPHGPIPQPKHQRVRTHTVLVIDRSIYRNSSQVGCRNSLDPFFIPNDQSCVRQEFGENEGNSHPACVGNQSQKPRQNKKKGNCNEISAINKFRNLYHS